MSMSFGLGASLNQSQKLTPQMQQAIKLLQMSSLELEQEVQAKLDSNPMLEREEEFGEEFERLSQNDGELSLADWSANSWETAKTSEKTSDDGFGDYEDAFDSLDKLDGSGIDEGVMDSDWQSVFGDDVGEFENYNQTPDTDDVSDQRATSACIQDHVRWQMNFKHLSVLDKLIAEQLIDAMDDSGFIRITLEEVVNHFATLLSFYEMDESIEVADVLAVLKMIQSCSPTGVGARDLSECLLLQLASLPLDTEGLAEARLVLGSAKHLQNNNIKELMNETGLDENEIRCAMVLIRSLDPNPAQSFDIEYGLEVMEREVPDILVLAKDSNKRKTTDSSEVASWRVMLNPETLPKLKINQEYASLIKRGDESVDNLYLKNNLQDARLFIRSIEERNQNLLKVATCIVRRQQGFLLNGAMAMLPLTLREVADEIGLHESTVSRLTTNKSMLTPQGVHSLKYFFSSHVSSDEGEVSSTAICAMINQIIASEDPQKPLSDDKITAQLESSGISISRRTVTKYREAMNIGSSTERKRQHGGRL